jgi:hypothetical protein
MWWNLHNEVLRRVEGKSPIRKRESPDGLSDGTNHKVDDSSDSHGTNQVMCVH